MKVFFRAPMRGKNVHEGYYKDVYNALEKLGSNIIDKYMLDHSMDSHYKQLEAGGEKAYEEFYDHEIEALKEADVNVFECSLPSLGTGLLVEKSLEFNKPTVVLYLKESKPHFLAGIRDDKLILKQVKDNLEKILKSALEEARDVADKRFNFFISPQLLSYLEEVSKQQGITKSTFIRGLIKEHMKKHRLEK